MLDSIDDERLAAAASPTSELIRFAEAPAGRQPAAPLRGEAARAALRRFPFAVRRAFALAGAMTQGSMDIVMPGGPTFRLGQEGPVEATVVIRDLGFAWRMLREGDGGIAESFIRGEWDSPDLAAVARVFAQNRAGMARMLDADPIGRLVQRVAHWLSRNTRTGARRNIEAHYDLGNAFFAAWLDPTMTYSAAMFGDGDAADLAAGQNRKYGELLRTIGVEPRHHLLEIGCGWGGLAEYAVREIGCRVTALTISKEQYDYARRRIYDAGMADKADVRLTDYRDATGSYDRIASVEMLEAVGEAYWPTYFRQLSDRLAPGGAAGLQVITMRDDLFAAYRRHVDFIRLYVFPGGMLPTPGILQSLGRRFGLELRSEVAFGRDYAATLVQWRSRFRAAWPQIATLGFDERFRRLWEYYLAYCEGGFLSGMIDVRQMAFAKPA